MGQHKGGTDTVIRERTDDATKKPKLYKVIIHNDEYTPLRFVTHVVAFVFHVTVGVANDIAWRVHQEGVGICGVFSREVAEAKASKVMDLATDHGHPLRAGFEPE